VVHLEFADAIFQIEDGKMNLARNTRKPYGFGVLILKISACPVSSFS
jgi:hypothetical protein